MDDGVLSAERADGQLTDRQFVADVHRLARRGQLLGGLRVGVKRGARIAVQKGGQALRVDVVGVLVGDHDRGQAGDALEAVREVARIEQHRRVAEIGKNAGMTEMRELHVYDCALMGCRAMRLVVVTTLIVGGLLVTCVWPAIGQADPETCPPVCDQIPDTAWIPREAIPLNSTYHWPALAAAAVSMTGAATPRFRFEEVCATPALPQRHSQCRGIRQQGDGRRPRRASGSCGPRWCTGAATRAAAEQSATSVFDIATAALRGCQLGVATESPSVTVDEPNRLSAVVSGPTMHAHLSRWRTRKTARSAS